MVGWGNTVASMNDVQPGDLLLMNYNEGGVAGPGHVGIYVGPNKMIHDPTPGGHVEYINIWETPGNIRRVV
jgi:cell wall-associated NlpC family hydrolase